ncbi:amidohydrolase family protein [Roseivirga sp. BDSF3-8]|uniref:amidohydrolase family protein n=1 Tax=Roseivirga sp. BDSF3-8 TaxID=3241598 RepID=UPI0035319684
MKNLLLSICLLFSCTYLAAQSRGVLIRDVEVVDVEKGTSKTASVLLKDDRISVISQRIRVPDGTEVIEGKGKWLIPGMVDTHIHFFQSGGVYTRPDALDLRVHRRYEDETEWIGGEADDLLKRYLRAGVTTVFDVGGPMSNYDLRDRYGDQAEYPNIYLTGPLISPYQPPALAGDDAPIIEVDDAKGARSEVRRQLPRQPDFIKIWYLDGKSMPADSSYAMVKAAIDESHGHGLKVAVHATQLHTAKLAIKAGADFLVHSVDNEAVDDEFIRLLQANDITYIPTLVVHGNYIKTYTETQTFSREDFALANPYALGSYYELKSLSHPLLDTLRKTDAFKDLLLSQSHTADSLRAYNLQKVSDAGVRIATGTDAGNIGTHHAASYYDELQAMKAAGMRDAAILKASTYDAVGTLDLEDELGSIEKGKRADLVVLNANPLEDIMAVKEVAYVIKNGRVYVPDSLIGHTPEDLAQEQLNAYNAGDIDAFLAPYSDSVEIYMFPDQLVSKGKEVMRQRYGQMFEQLPELHCKLTDRVVLGNTVIDKEYVTGVPNGPVEAIAIYKIENGRIARVYFVRP